MLSIFIVPQVKAINLDNIPANNQTSTDDKTSEKDKDKDEVKNITSTDMAEKAGYDKDVTTIMIVNRVIKVVLGLSSTAAIILILIAGVKYMMSQGNQADITKSMRMMGVGFVGIAIMATAYVTSNFIINQIETIVYKDTLSHYVKPEDDGEEEEEWETGGVTVYDEYPGCLEKYKVSYCKVDEAIKNKQADLNTKKEELSRNKASKLVLEEQQQTHPVSDPVYASIGGQIVGIAQTINKQEKEIEKLENEISELEKGQRELRNEKKITSKSVKDLLGSSVGFAGDLKCKEYTEIWDIVNSNYCDRNE